MRKKNRFLIMLLVAFLFISNVTPAFVSSAAEGTDESLDEGSDSEDAASEGNEEETETETEWIPESYYAEIQSNKIKNWPEGPMVEADAAIVMDADTGACLYSKNVEAKEFPASITKILTTLVAIENWPENRLDKKIKASEEALSTIGPDSSQIWLSPGEKITMRQALYAIMLASANDAANVVAETIAGSVDGFVDLMNQKVKELGCINTHFVNPHGLHDDDHYTCAYDMALITRAAYQNPLFREIASTVEYKIPKTKYMKEDRWMINHQKMLYDDEFYYEYCVGGKTGFTDNAWNTLVTIAKKEDMNLVCVELYVNGAWKTFNESKELLEYGFNHFRHEKMPTGIVKKTIADLAGESRFGVASILNDDAMNQQAIKADESVTVTIPNKVKIERLEKVTTDSNQISYTYRDWPVGSVPVSYVSPIVEVEQPKPPETEAVEGETGAADRVDHEISEGKTDAAGNTFVDKADNYMKKAIGETMGVWTSFNNWVTANEVPAAIIGMVLIVLLIPLLCIAYVRDKNARRIEKERELEKETRQQMEENIDSKSIQEIEAEIRAELEKERLKKEKEEARKRAAEEEEKRLKELEQVIDKKEDSHELGSTDKG